MKVPTSEAFLLATFALALAAALFDWRTRRIPNAVTFGGMALAVPLHMWLSPSPVGLESCFIGAFMCALPAAIGWKLGWVAGGDLKLLAAMGAVGGISFGIEAVFLGLFCASGFVFLRLCWNGAFLRTLGNGFAVAATRTIARGRAIAPAAEYSEGLRFGPFALAGAALSLYLNGVFG